MHTLTRDEAVTRANLVRVDGYDIELDLTAARASTEFGSTTRVRFSLRDPAIGAGTATFAELKPVTAHLLRLNGRLLDPAALDGNRLPLTDLVSSNELTVTATMRYSNTGEGLHRFTDPEDGEVYLYAQTFLDDAQRMFACFDQPDLKAPVRLTVLAPPDWVVRANGAGRQTAPGRWEFTETPPLATYFVTVVAGPYHVVEDSHDGIPLGLVCRRSLAPYLDADAAEIFDVTRACLDRYHELFADRYPFGTYDQAFVPEFNAGAMENPGCVTFRDEFVYRSAVTDTERELRAVVIAHEMAHMWFGDLVTMRWWDDLWLNESFAEYMGYRVTAEATRFTEAWTSFAVGRKGWGYAADQRPSTHPVAPANVDDTALALLNFDGISYAKGASVLRQLVAWVGDEAFLTGLRAYFTRNAYGNATLADLLAALTEASGRDLTGWAELWLRREQVNTLRPQVTVDAQGRYQQVTVVQTAPEAYPTLRPHRLGIGVYGPADGAGRDGGSVVGSGNALDGTGTGTGTGNGDGGETDEGDAAPIELLRRVEVDIDPAAADGRTTVTALAGTAAGRLLLVNDGDLTYAKVRFTPADLAALPAVLPRVADPLARAMIWAATADATRDAQWPAADYLALAASALPSETQLAVFEDALRFARATALTRYLAPSARPAAAARLHAACLRALADAAPGSGRQLSAARGVIGCSGPGEVDGLAAWLAGQDVPAGLLIDPELRWTLLHRLVVLGRAGETEIAAEGRRDRSARAAEHAARARAAIADAAAKARAWELIVADDSASARLIGATAEGFWQPEQDDLTADYVARYFEQMPAMSARRTPHAARQIATFAYPQYAVSAGTLRDADALLDRGGLDPVLRRVVIDATDELRRAVRARART
ncbi:aminopeptidase N [Frankia sp. ACN1ag]|uniref:aminopeptidase N n=2 Tax=unclassified Frankia TaxID=2632575 RepID=UPI0006DCF61F|nr:aminopeptidase N [Frankia sp. ACN1ag]KQC38797.1 aminopeptidase [Frankia sp. ACN1ag]